MGLLKFMARLGAVGGTARIIAKQFLFYKNLHKNNESITDLVIYRLIIQDRYTILKNQNYEDYLLKNAENFKGLRDLVVEILTLEAGFSKNDSETQQLFIDVIDEELLKKKISPKDIYNLGQR